MEYFQRLFISLYLSVSFARLTSTFSNYGTLGEICHDHDDCIVAQGFYCKDNRCACDHICDFPAKFYGEACVNDAECMLTDRNFLCVGGKQLSPERACRCRKQYFWDISARRCIKPEDDSNHFDLLQHIIVPGVIVVSVATLVFLGIKVFCNWKLWRRSPMSPLSREMNELSSAQHQQTTWVASYRVFSPLGSQARPPLQPPSCMGLFLSSQTIGASPPPYEEALKHKVVLSSYHPVAIAPQSQMPVPVGLYVPQVQPESILLSSQNSRISILPDGDQLRYYSGDEHSEAPPVWTSHRVIECNTPDGRPRTLVRSSRERRSGTSHHRHYSPDSRRCSLRESET